MKQIINDQYIRKPQLLYAMRYLRGVSADKIKKFISNKGFKISIHNGYLLISGPKGDIKIPQGDWIIKEIGDNIYSVSNDFFDSLFIPMDDYNKGGF